MLYGVGMEIDTTTTHEMPGVLVTISVYSEALGESIQMLMPEAFIPTLADIVADQRTVYGPNFSRAIVESLFDLSRATRWGEYETADRLVDYLTLKQRDLVISDSRRMQEEAR